MWADRICGKRNPWGVCAAKSDRLSSVAETVEPSAERLMVSVTGMQGRAPS